MQTERLEASLAIAAQRLPLRQWADALRKLDGEPLVWTPVEARSHAAPDLGDKPRTGPVPRRIGQRVDAQISREALLAAYQKQEPMPSAWAFYRRIAAALGCSDVTAKHRCLRAWLKPKVAKGAV